MKNKFPLFFLIFLFSISAVFSQNSEKPRKVHMGIINGSAVSLPQPVYPAAAAALNASGEVKVSVVIDEQGTVVSAEAVSGHPLLRAASVEAAKLAKFRPTLLSGAPVTVSGVIVYNFLPNEPKGFEEELTPMAFAMIISVYDSVESDKELTGIIDDIFKDFNDYYEKPKITGKVSEMPSAERKKIFEELKSNIRKEFSVATEWQFEAGELFGEVLGKFVTNLLNKNELVPEADLRSSLMKINELNARAPKDFPAPVLEKFKEVGDFANRKNLGAIEAQWELFLLLEEVFNLISPDDDEDEAPEEKSPRREILGAQREIGSEML